MFEMSRRVSTLQGTRLRNFSARINSGANVSRGRRVDKSRASLLLLMSRVSFFYFYRMFQSDGLGVERAWLVGYL